ncbi:hypothetical protein [Bradyrhizobium elkanii]|uniref:hypothetical protein n=1 Tax=Bradyrhizobium elkanii TaxID=29448 RepID=UPI0004890609|nr:hypothetical protein [Bradyrhizobium elkanii]
MATNILIASSVAATSFAIFSAAIVAIQIISAWVAFILYPLIYSELSKDASHFRPLCRRLAAPLLAVTIFSGILALATVARSEEIESWQVFAVGSGLAASAVLPAFALGLQNYRMFNTLELVPSVLGLALIALIRPTSAGDLIVIASVGYLLKSAVYILWLLVTYNSFAVHRDVDWKAAVRNGAAVGLSGAAQSAAFRAILLSASFTVPASYFVLVAVAWQFAEKVLVVPQAVNAIMFGQFKRSGTIKGSWKILALGSAGSLAVILVTLAALMFFRETFAGSYDHIAGWFILVSLLFVAQGVRIMLQNCLNALGKSRIILWDAVAMLAANGTILLVFGVVSASSVWSLPLYYFLLLASLFVTMRQYLSLGAR